LQRIYEGRATLEGGAGPGGAGVTVEIVLPFTRVREGPIADVTEADSQPAVAGPA
jgi:hypothetical protein